jgi:predicted phosphodiesterase
VGAQFQLEHVNFVAYLTAEQKHTPPRSDRASLRDFLSSFADRHRILSSTISNDPNWQSSLQQRSISVLRRVKPGRGDLLSPEQVGHILDPLREFFTGYALYALFIPGKYAPKNSRRDIDRLYHSFVRDSRLKILVLRPDTGTQFLNIIDPFPALQALARLPVAPPVVVFWTPAGGSLALPLSQAEFFFRELMYRSQLSDFHLDRLIQEQSFRSGGRKLLHISDLHFGNALADSRRHYLRQHLATVAHNVDRIVISGDLFNTPSSTLRTEFEEFKADLLGLTTKRPIIVVGNHDVRRSGNALARFGRNSDFVIDVGVEPIVVDHDIKTVFCCFNSCEGGKLARGRVSEQQRRDRAADLERHLRLDDRLTNYIKIAVVHHHPYSYSTQPTALYERIMSMVLKNPDALLAFENAGQFVNWCGVRGISLILHGHKHVPHMVMAKFSARGVHKEMMIVGCGSTTGVENKPMCYDVIGINPDTGRFSVSFYHDPDGDGSGFSLQSVALDLREGLPQ